MVDTNVIGEIAEITADASRLDQVISNLLSNSIKFSQAGSEVFVDVDMPDCEQIRIQVRDQGVGILPEDLPRLFNKFVQGRNINNNQAGGTGLGLYISWSIIEAHDGQSSIDSAPGEGSIFEILLPVNPAEDLVWKEVDL